MPRDPEVVVADHPLNLGALTPGHRRQASHLFNEVVVVGGHNWSAEPGQRLNDGWMGDGE
jgi:hypothetical protein